MCEKAGGSRQIKEGVVVGFHVPSRVVVVDTLTDKVISRGVKTLLSFNIHNDLAGFSKAAVYFK